MPRFTTLFLLKAMAVTALCCAPMLFNEPAGMVATALLLPMAFCALAAFEVTSDGPWSATFTPLSTTVTEVRLRGGSYAHRTKQARLFVAGFCLSLAAGFPALHQIDPEPVELWLPIVVGLALTAVLLLGLTIRRRVDVDRRRLQTDHLIFGRLCVWRSSWRVRDGDTLAFVRGFAVDEDNKPCLPVWHGLWVYRSCRCGAILFGAYAGEDPDPTLEQAATELAALLDVPYAGYRKSISAPSSSKRATRCRSRMTVRRVTSGRE